MEFSPRAAGVAGAAGRAAAAGAGDTACFECLEPRRVLGVVNWDGGGDGVSWHDGNNWDTNTVPGVLDDAVVSVPANPTIQFTGTTGARAVNSLVTDEAITFSGGSLAVTTTADVNATATLNGGTLSGGTWDASGGSLVFAANSSNRVTNGVTILGTVTFPSNGRLQVEGGWTVSGTVSVGSGILGFRGSTTLTGADYTLAGGAIGPISPGAGSHTLTIGAGVTVSGRGDLGQFTFSGGGTGHLVNNGTIRADAGANQTLTVNPQDDLVNNGTLAAANQGVLHVGKANWQNAGTLDATTGGRLNFAQGLVLGAGGTVRIGFAGPTAALYGRITVTGNAALGGAFVGRYDGGYVPPEGTFHDFMTASGTGAAITGVFASITLPAPPAGDKSVFIQEPTRLRLLSTDLADFDENGALDIFDFLLFQNLWDAMDPRADLDQSTGPGVFDVFDFLAFFNMFEDG